MRVGFSARLIRALGGRHPLQLRRRVENGCLRFFLSMLLLAAALIREQEHSTIDHLLVLPLSPVEIMLGRVWANALVVQAGTLACLYLVIQGLLAIPLAGSLALFMFGTFIDQFTITAIGMVLTTLVGSVAQFVPLLLAPYVRRVVAFE